MNTKVKFGVSLDPELLSEIDLAAARTAVTRSAYVRRCVVLAMPLIEAKRSIDYTRVLTQMEYQQGALAMLVQDRFPENHDALLSAAISRVEEFHGEG